MKKLQNNKSGFTIIEVLIVLAIAGLIMLIVFLAVPALQRNSRNTQRRNDVGKLLGAVNEWGTADNWVIPSGIAGLLGVGDKIIKNTGDMSIYNENMTAFGGDVALGLGAGGINTNTNYVTLNLNAKCSNSTTAIAQPRSAAAMYYIETGSGFVAQCIDS